MDLISIIVISFIIIFLIQEVTLTYSFIYQCILVIYQFIVFMY